MYAYSVSKELTLATYFPAVPYAKALDVIGHVAEGDTVTKACAALFITVASFRSACKKEPILQALLEEAMEVHDDLLADLLVNIDSDPNGSSDAKMANVRSSNIRFILERRRPAKYGKTAQDANPLDETNRQLAEALNKAMDRMTDLADARRPKTITDVTFVDAPHKEAAPVKAPQGVWEETQVITQSPLEGLERLRLLGFV